MHNARPFLISFVLDQAEEQPVAKRIDLYRALAEIAGSPSKTQQLQSLANELEAAQLRCRQFAFDFTQKKGAA